MILDLVVPERVGVNEGFPAKLALEPLLVRKMSEEMGPQVIQGSLYLAALGTLNRAFGG